MFARDDDPGRIVAFRRVFEAPPNLKWG